MSQSSFLIAIDTGGTFTDCIAVDNVGKIYTCKVLSNSTLRGSIEKWIDEKTLIVKHNWQIEKDIFQEYEFKILNTPLSTKHKLYVKSYDFVQKIITLNKPLPIDFLNQNLSFEITAHEEAPVLAARLITQTGLKDKFPPLLMRLGSTKGTNALLERKGAPTAFFVTKGFMDLLKIGNQQRPDLFALQIIKPEPLYTEGVEVDERLNADGSVLMPISNELIIKDLEKIILKLKKKKIQSVAVALMHAYRNPAHELLLKEYLKKHFDYVSVSSELSQQIKFVPRAQTTVVNAYLAPIIDAYISNITRQLPDESLRVMTSAGSLVHASFFQPKDSLLSGPAGGIVGAATIGKQSGYTRLLTFDMGGTSTDVARFDKEYEYKFDVTIGAATVFSPALNIETVAAGGGSICYFDGFKLCVGPESAGASPGPACYGAGGSLTITDVQLLLGRLDASQFGIPVFPEASAHKLSILQGGMLECTQQNVSKEDILNGFIAIANERMADAIKKISIAKGYAPPQYALVAFGGAGGLHACSMANLLEIPIVLLPKYAGLLSAYGILNAQIERFTEKQILKVVSQMPTDFLENVFKNLSDEAIEKVQNEGIPSDHIFIKKQIIYCRLKGQDAALDVPFDSDFLENFKIKYKTIYGHWVEKREIEIESIRVIASEKPATVESKISEIPIPYSPHPNHFIQSYVENTWRDAPVFFRNELKAGATIEGFALLLDNYSTTVIEQDFTLIIDENETAIIKKNNQINQIKTIQHAQTIDLELFINRFTNIAEAMGIMLQRTSLSVNVKERLDFSCALLDAEGYLIANAPHIPVHLGSLGVCVRTVLQHFKLEKGDTIVTNHPAFGGSHLPDVTLITPVYTEGGQLIGYVCNRCHHAEFGGIRPASMPPNATRLIEEGVIIPPTYLVKNDVIDWESIHYILTKNKYPTRSIDENIADLNAALAANLNGVQALQTLTAEHGLDSVHFYMQRLKDYTAEKLKAALKMAFPETASRVYEATEKMDDGTILKVRIDFSNDTILFDFTGTSPVHKGNLNATPAIVNSVVIYVLRLLLKENIPLNEGIMQNVRIILPENSILNPDFNLNGLDVIASDSAATEGSLPAVVGGNVETSQRLTDTILKALGILACGQGTMNNVLFGNDTFGYYETICGGAGAGDGFAGADAVHTHMTNTRITDPEIMELRYPVRLDTFKIRKNSGGKGRFKGGDGIFRELTFLAPVELSVLSQHRVVAPFGLQGGGNGQLGKHYLLLKNGRKKRLKGIDGASVTEGDSFVIETPGGGGFGSVID